MKNPASFFGDRGRGICAVLVTSVALAGCGGSSSTAPSPQPTQPPSVSGHLYVATTTAPAEVLRYPLVRGVPASAADLTLQGAGAPICVGPSGNIYAASATNPDEVLIFASGSSMPERSVVLKAPSASDTKITIDTIAVDGKGFLYAGVMYLYGGQLTNEDVWTFAPGAAGNTLPIATITLIQYPSFNTPLGGMAFGGGQLYVSEAPIFEGQNTTGFVQFITSPESNPQLGSSIAGGALTLPGGLTIDDAGDLYVVNEPSNITSKGTPQVLVYAPPSSTPLRSITSKAGTVMGTPAVSNGILFVPGTDVVYELNANNAGPQQPIATLNVTGASAVALGP